MSWKKWLTRSLDSRGRLCALLRLETLESREVPAAEPFTAGNLVIYRVGDGSATLTSAATIVYLDEYDSSGTLVQSIAMPVKADTDNGINRLTASGTATSEGLLTLSADGQYLVLTGYDAATGTSSIAGTSSSTVGRTIGRVDWDGVIDTSTVLSDFSSGSNARGVSSTDGTEFWASGGAGGIRYAQLGDTKSTNVTSGTTLENYRFISIFNQQLYVSTASGSNPRVGTIGEGLPTTDGQVYTGLAGMVTTGSAYGFQFFDLTTDVDGLDTLYVAFDDKEGLRKFSFDGKEWTAADTNFTSSSAVRGLTGRISEKGLVELFVVSNGAELVRVIDEAGWNEDFKASSETLAKAERNTVFRGVAFAPQRFASITRNDASITNADSVSYTVVFREEVLDLDVDDFELTIDGKITDAAVKSVEGEGTKYTVTVATGTGDGTLRLDIKKGASILDANKNTLTYTAATGEVYTIDKTAPTVSSVVRASGAAQRTSATSVSFTVTFSEDVSGITASSFGVNGTATGASISGVSGSGSTYTVTVTTGSVDGTLGLTVKSSVADAAGNTLGSDFTSGETYIVDKTAPTVSTVVRTTPSTERTNANSVTFTVTFSESMTGITAASFGVNGTATGASIDSISGSGASYVVTVTTGSVDGTLGLTVKSGAADQTGNTLAADFTGGETFTIDKTAPTVTSVTREAPSSVSTNASIVTFSILFDESVDDLTASDLLLTGSVTDASIDSISGSGTTWSVSVVTGSVEGTLGLTVLAGVPDLAGNTLAADFSGGETFTIDKTAPTVTSVTRTTPTTALTNADTVTFTVTFSEAVADLTLGDLALSGTSTGGSIDSVSGSGTTWTISVITGSDGTLGLTVLTGVADLAGNTLTADFTGSETYTIDKTAPTVVRVTALDDTTTNAATVRYEIEFSEELDSLSRDDLALAVSGLVGSNIGDPVGSGTLWTVTITTGSGEGTLRLDVVSATDKAGNPLADPFETGDVYTIDRTAPTVVSILRNTPSAERTNAPTVSFTVTFNESVTGVDLPTFALSGTASEATLESVTGSGTIWTVVVATGGISGTIRLDAVADANVLDQADNALEAGYIGDESYTLDLDAPEVKAIEVDVTSPTRADMVTFTITFTEAVEGVTESALELTGTTGATIASVSGSGDTWTVVVNTAADGVFGLNVLTTGSIADLATNPLEVAFNGPTVTVDKTAPMVSSVTRETPSNALTNADMVTFTVTFSEAVADLTLGDLSLSGTSTGGSIESVSGSGTTWSVTVLTGGDGTLGLTVLAGVPDLAGNTLAADFTESQTFTIDKTAPTVTSVVRTGAVVARTNASTVSFTVTFSEAVSELTASDLMLTGTATGATLGTLSGSGTTWTVSVVTGNVDGTLGLTVLAGVPDLAGNTLAADFSGGETFTIDKTAPMVTSVTRTTPTTALTNADVATFTVTFSEAVADLTASDLQLSGTSTGGSIDGVSGSGTTWTVGVTTGGDGTLGVTVLTGVPDLAGNTLVADFTSGEIFTIDKTAPTVTSVTRTTPTTALTNADTVTFTVTFSKAVADLTLGDLQLSGSSTGGSIESVSGSGTTWSVSVITGGDGTLGLTVLAGVADLAGNTLTADFTGGETYTIDKTAPTVTSVVRTGAVAARTNASTVSFTVTFSEAVSELTASDLMLTGTATGATLGTLSGSGTTWTVSVVTGNVDGTLGLTVLAGVPDLAGNTLAADFSGGETFTIDKTAPTVSSVTRVGTSPTNATSVIYTVTFSEMVTGVDASDFQVFTVAGTVLVGSLQVSGSGNTYTVTLPVTGTQGMLRLDVSANGSISDGLNPLTQGFTSGETFVVDNVAPTVLRITRLDASPTTARSLRFQVVFSENVSGVDAGDFGIATTGLIDAASITSVAGTGSTYTVTVNAGTGNGTLGLNVVANGSIVDGLNNALNQGFSNGQAYTVNRPTQPARVTLNVGEPRVLVGTTITLTANVQQQGTAGERSVTFKRGSVVLGTVPLDASKTASLDVSGLPVGTYVFTAHYNGDNETGPGSSTAVSVQVMTRNGMFVYNAWNALTGLNNASVLPNYIAALEQGNTNRTQVVLQMQRTAPFFVSNVQRTYRELLGRAPTAAELNARVTLLAQGQTVPQLQVWLMSQPEYFLRRGAGTASGYLAAIARDLTRNVANPTARNALVSSLMSTGAPLLPANLTNLAARQGFVANLFNSPVGRSARVWDLFGRYQGTGADGRLSTFATLLRGPLGYNQVVAALLGSQTFAS